MLLARASRALGVRERERAWRERAHQSEGYQRAEGLASARGGEAGGRVRAHATHTRCRYQYESSHMRGARSPIRMLNETASGDWPALCICCMTCSTESHSRFFL